MLNYKISQRHRAQAGFTMVEVLVVLVIIGMIMGLAATTVFKQNDDSRISAAKIQIESFKQALQLFELDNGRYPTTEEGLKILTTKGPEDVETKKGPWIKSTDIPKDPWKHDYKYQLNEGAEPPYYLYSEGVQGKPETKVGSFPAE